MKRWTDHAFTALIPATILIHLVFAPYTKVEESFNIQATHDILRFGVPFRNADQKFRDHYDHLTFPGSVPRTFVGSLALAGVSWPFAWLLKLCHIAVSQQLLVRAVLGLFNAYCLVQFRQRVARAFGRDAANWYALFQASQFHVMYYASRTLPNFFAFGLTTLANRNLLPLAGRSPSSRSSRQRQTSALILLTATTIIFRAEIAILTASYSVYLFLHPYIRLRLVPIILSGQFGAILGLSLTVPVDTFFWRHSSPLWPELAGFKYNILNSKASDWGTSPWHFYFTSSLPRLLFNPFLLFVIPFTISVPIFRRSALDILIPNITYIAIYSFQPHKEWRFIVYTIPPILAVASAGASWIWTRRAKTMTYRVLALALVASTMAAFFASSVMCAISRLNYPGGQALDRLHELAAVSGETGILRVHMDTLACMTGVTRFLQKDSPLALQPPDAVEEGRIFWIYDKTEGKENLLDPAFWATVDYALAERPEKPLGQWEILDTVDAFARFRILKPGEDLDERRDCAASFTGGVIEGLKRSSKGITQEKKQGLAEIMACLYKQVEGHLREHITRGWWMRIKMEPRINILKKAQLVAEEKEVDCKNNCTEPVVGEVEDVP